MNVLNITTKNIFLVKIVFLFICITNQACSDSSIGEKLSNSFDSPTNSTSKILLEKKEKEKEKEKKIIKSVKNNDMEQEKKDSIKDDKDELLIKAKPNKKKSIFSKNIMKFKPQTYRLILILKGANPSSPSEDVTRVLIQEGIQFEVERIERYKDQSSIEKLSSKRQGF